MVALWALLQSVNPGNRWFKTGGSWWKKGATCCASLELAEVLEGVCEFEREAESHSFFFEENVWVFFKSWLFLGPAFFDVMMFWPSRCASAPLCVFWTFYNDTGGARPVLGEDWSGPPWNRCYVEATRNLQNWQRHPSEVSCNLKPHCHTANPPNFFDRNWSSGTSWDAPLYNIRVKDVMSSRYCGIA